MYDLFEVVHVSLCIRRQMNAYITKDHLQFHRSLTAFPKVVLHLPGREGKLKSDKSASAALVRVITSEAQASWCTQYNLVPQPYYAFHFLRPLRRSARAKSRKQDKSRFSMEIATFVNVLAC